MPTTKIIKVSKDITIIEREFYFFGQRVKTRRIVLTEKYKKELEQKFHERLLNKGKEYGE